MRKHKKVTRRQRSKYRYKSQKKVVIRKRRKAIPVPVIIVKKEILPPYEIKPRKRRRKKGSSKMYFDQTTEDAIILYNSTEDSKTREEIFNSKILYPFQKLVENVLNTFKFSYFETGPQDVQKECLSHLVANIHKFDPERRSKVDPNKKAKAFAYFSIIAKNYLILLNNTNYKKFNQNVEISEERDENTVQLQQEDKYYARKELSDFVRLIIEFWDKNIEKIFTKEWDRNIAYAVIELFRHSDNVPMFNKKALYLYIREISNCRTQQITKVINRMKQHHNTIRRSYFEHGQVDTDRYALA